MFLMLDAGNIILGFVQCEISTVQSPFSIIHNYFTKNINVSYLPFSTATRERDTTLATSNSQLTVKYYIGSLYIDK